MELPVDDGVIERALSELDAKLSLWLDAVRTVEEAVCERATLDAAAAPAADTAVESDAESESGVMPEPDATPAAEVISEPEARAAEAEKPEDVEGPAEPEMPEERAEPAAVDEPPADVASDTPDEEAAPPPTSSDPPAGSRLMSGTRPARVEPQTPTSDSDERAALAEEDEALLASLDEKTRAAVLIRRRLYGRTKSVRELLDDISRLGLGQDDSRPQSKRWWRR